MVDKRKLEQTADEKCGNGHNRNQYNGSQSKQARPDYLGPLPVALGENANNYDRFFSEVVKFYNPSDPIEWMHVCDIADGEWQKRRMGGTIATCIDVAMVDAIAKVLTSRGQCTEWSALSYARGYLTGSEDGRLFVLDFLRENGLTEESLTYTAVSMRAVEIERMERSAMMHQACRDEAIRCLQRHRANRAATLPKPFVEDAEYHVIEDKSKDKKEGLNDSAA